MKKASKAMAFGTFDILHPGHRYYLREAKKQATSLVVVVARDATVLKVKRKPPVNNEQERVRNLRKLGIADRVILGNPGDKYQVIKREKPDLLCFGYDQSHITKGIGGELKRRGISPRIVRIVAYKPHIYKSSKLREGKSKNIK